MAMLTSTIVLYMHSGRGGYETTLEAGRGLSLFLKSIAQKGLQSGVLQTLNIDCEKNSLAVEPSDGRLSQWKCPKDIRMVSVTGIEGFSLDAGTDFIEIPPEGLEQSLQFVLVGVDLKEVIVTWKLGGLLCDIDNNSLEQWSFGVERF